MGKLIYSAHTSLDGYTVDREGNFDFTAPDEEVHAFVNDLERGIGTYLFGRKIYETMSVWDTWDTTNEPRVVQEFASIWNRINKVVYSRGLHTVGTRLTRIEREFVPDEVRALKDTSPDDISIGGAHLAAEALRAGLIDEAHLFLSPVIVGGGHSRTARRCSHQSRAPRRNPLRRRRHPPALRAHVLQLNRSQGDPLRSASPSH